MQAPAGDYQSAASRAVSFAAEPLSHGHSPYMSHPPDARLCASAHGRLPECCESRAVNFAAEPLSHGRAPYASIKESCLL
ncbi:hypothetical protein BRYFOR_06900 [Marvinbryantia formatexigens DSM 14469]|uniref:Uncharacterized protein n=1 Tax=Marvinbryantia formatexigens DSM 14469 TaxID=478749 RepID=C6LE51_9FIRM|nr:hypothetical protein [Marvinbryantia formatexigens]EET61255.1 hypothetical protein BRYFOR_06900 [Marvinbryantia formatexigens DSM 14469]